MSKLKTSSKEIDPARQYRVNLSRPVEVAPGVWARGGDHVIMVGDVLTSHKDSVESYEEA
jgi:hypothetical protein